MPNIIITNYCNLKCPYCFASEMLNDPNKKNISESELKRILAWLEKSPPPSIGLIGGEPTLHPDFANILSIVNEYNQRTKTKSILFTNGVYIQDYLLDISNTMSLLINTNAPGVLNENASILFKNNLMLMKKMGWFNVINNHSKAVLGCNLCLDITDYSFFWEWVDLVEAKIVRVSVTAPTKQEYKEDKHKYYENMKDIYLNFINEANKRNIFVNQDCNQIQYCYFTQSEINSIINATHNDFVKKCQPVIDISPDFQATSCFGIYDLVECNQFDTLKDLSDYLYIDKMVPKIKANNEGKCQSCLKHKLYICQGGCLAFSKNDNL